MRYLNQPKEKTERSHYDLDRIYPMLTGRHRVLRVFEKMDYRYVHMGSWWEPTRSHHRAEKNYNVSNLFTSSEVIEAYSRGTMQPFVYEKLLPLLDIGAADRVSDQCRRIPFQFDALKSIVDDTTPTFVFAHFLLPHSPYVFVENGRCMSAAEADGRTVHENYIGQLRYPNRRFAN
jgi:hypothetical protein